MYSDTHFHFSILDEGNILREEVLKGMADSQCYFALDIGTQCNDLASRERDIELATYKLEPAVREKVQNFIYFSAGIWPNKDAIVHRARDINVLEKSIEDAKKSKNPFFQKVIAIGECGIDHHWNPSGADSRDQNDFSENILKGELDLFEKQLLLAKKLSLPVIVHSRDAFAETLSCIDKIGYDNGIIHCYSYGLEEAKAFLERGWFIAFGGGITYTKKSHIEEMKNLVRYIPSDRLFIETDAPYLSPVPLRGTPNSPLNIKHIYKFIADIRRTDVAELCATVDENADRLFGLK